MFPYQRVFIAVNSYYGIGLTRLYLPNDSLFIVHIDAYFYQTRAKVRSLNWFISVLHFLGKKFTIVCRPFCIWTF